MTLGKRNRRWEELNKANIPLSKLIECYEIFNLTEGKSPKTISWYTETLVTFEKFLRNSRESTLLGDIGIQEVREFILYLQQKQKCNGSHGASSNGARGRAVTISYRPEVERASRGRHGVGKDQAYARPQPPPTTAGKTDHSGGFTMMYTDSARNTKGSTAFSNHLA